MYHFLEMSTDTINSKNIEIKTETIDSNYSTTQCPFSMQTLYHSDRTLL